MRVLPVFLFACAAPDALLPVEQAPPPVFTLSSPATVAPGGTLSVTISGTLGEDEEVELNVGRAGVGAGPCPALYGGLCLDVRNPVVVARDLIDANGALTFSIPVPSTLPLGTTFGLQGVVIRGNRGARSVKSNTTSVTTAAAPAHGDVTFGYTGAASSFVVPAGVSQLRVEACGGQGGDGWNIDVDTPLGNGGLGGRIEALIPVTAGETLLVYVGGTGGDGAEAVPGVGGFNGGGNGADRFGYTGGGGGGASDVRRDAQLSSRLVVAGGGGAGSGWCTAGTGHGGVGGGNTAGSGQLCSNIPVGTGGTQTSGGSLGGALGVGGSATTDGGAGGGGGFYGGGASNGSGGGGGSSTVAAGGTVISDRAGVCSGDGSVIVHW